MGRYRPFIFLGLAIVIGFITSLLIYNWLQSKTVTKATSEVRAVAVAMVDLPAGTVLNKEVIKTVPFLRGSLSEGAYFSDPASLQGKVVMFPVRANEPILRSRLTPDNIAAGGVAAIIDPKKRAMAVKVDKVIGVSGFIHPGNHVDVLVTLQHKGDKDSAAITKIVLQNMLVLAAGTEMEQRGKNEKPVPVDVITLELTPEEAEKLAHATTQGPIHMALRGYTNSEEVTTRGATIPSLLTGSSPETTPQAKPHTVRLAKSSVAAEKPPAGVNVDVLVGNKKETKTFKAE